MSTYYLYFEQKLKKKTQKTLQTPVYYVKTGFKGVKFIQIFRDVHFYLLLCNSVIQNITDYALNGFDLTIMVKILNVGGWVRLRCRVSCLGHP